MSAADWYRRVLGGGGAPPTQPNLPPTSVGAPVPWAPQGQVAYEPSSHYAPQQQQAVGQPQNMTQAMQYMNQHGWRGGDGVRTERYSCPRCHGNLFFTRLNGPKVMGMPPAPRCQECGWNGLWEQFGDRLIE